MTEAGQGVPQIRVGSFLLLHVGFFVYSLVTVFAKEAGVHAGMSRLFVVFLVAEVLALGVYALLWQQSLRRFPLTPAYASKGIVVVWNLVWAVVLFHERITAENLLGAVLVIVGIMIVSADAR